MCPVCLNDRTDKRLTILQSFTLSLFDCRVLTAAMKVFRERADNHLNVGDYQSCTHLVLWSSKDNLTVLRLLCPLWPVWPGKLRKETLTPHLAWLTWLAKPSVKLSSDLNTGPVQHLARPCCNHIRFHCTPTAGDNPLTCNVMVVLGPKAKRQKSPPSTGRCCFPKLMRSGDDSEGTSISC